MGVLTQASKRRETLPKHPKAQETINLFYFLLYFYHHLRDPNNLDEERVYLAYRIIPSSRKAKAGAQGRNLEAGTKAITVEECFLQACAL